MNLLKKSALVALSCAFVLVALGGCEKKETPGEKLDKAIDHAADKAKEAGK